MRQIIILETHEYSSWLEEQTTKNRSIIDSRILRIEEESYFGDHKYLGDNIFELRWKNGRRIYFSKFENREILLLLGGLKNAQKKDIKKAKYLFRRYAFG